MNKNKVALIVGCFAAFMHFVWSLLVALGWAQLYLNWIFGLHFLNNPFNVAGFDWAKAVTLIIFTFIAGYILGWVFATIWNTIHKNK